MKLEQLFENIALGTHFEPAEFEVIYNVLVDHKEELNITDIKGLAQEVSEREDWQRNAGSARFALSRMHVLVHGVASHGVSEKTAETWMVPSAPMDKFAESKGINVDGMVDRARRELKGRKAKISYEDAKKMMADFARQNRDLITNRVREERGAIIAHISAGLSAKEAFAIYA